MSDFVDLTTDVIAQLKRLADAFDGGDDCTDNVLDNLELIRTRLIFMSQEEKRIADALERISPPHGWEYKQVAPDWIESTAQRGWEFDSVLGYDTVLGQSTLWVLVRRPRQAPAEGD